MASYCLLCGCAIFCLSTMRAQELERTEQMPMPILRASHTEPAPTFPRAEGSSLHHSGFLRRRGHSNAGVAVSGTTSFARSVTEVQAPVAANTSADGFSRSMTGSMPRMKDAPFSPITMQGVLWVKHEHKVDGSQPLLRPWKHAYATVQNRAMQLYHKAEDVHLVCNRFFKRKGVFAFKPVFF